MSNVIVFCGSPCSGKTTLAKTVAQDIMAFYLGLDEIGSFMKPNSVLLQNDRDRIYEFINKFLGIYHYKAVIDATYQRKERCNNLLMTGRNILVVECIVNPDIAVERFLNRNDNKNKALTEYRVRFLATKRSCLNAGLTIDTTNKTEEESINIVREFLEISL